MQHLDVFGGGCPVVTELVVECLDALGGLFGIHFGDDHLGPVGRKKLAAPVAGTVFFAGEAMNPNGKTIAVHGACESAYTAVEALLSPTHT